MVDSQAFKLVIVLHTDHEQNGLEIFFVWFSIVHSHHKWLISMEIIWKLNTSRFITFSFFTLTLKLNGLYLLCWDMYPLWLFILVLLSWLFHLSHFVIATTHVCASLLNVCHWKLWILKNTSWNIRLVTFITVEGTNRLWVFNNDFCLPEFWLNRMSNTLSFLPLIYLILIHRCCLVNDKTLTEITKRLINIIIKSDW